MKHTVPTLETARFTLRNIEPGDTAHFLPTFADEEQMRWWSRGPFESADELDGWLRDPDWDGHCWIAEDRATGAPVARLVAIPDDDPAVMETGYLVVKTRQHDGVARECMTALLDHMFGAMELRRVWADTDPDNTPSNRLLESLGFACEGRLREQWETHIGVRDSFIWGLLAREWRG